MANRTQVCSVEIWIEETRTLFRARGIIIENILLLKNQRQTKAVALNGENALILLPTASGKP